MELSIKSIVTQLYTAVNNKIPKKLSDLENDLYSSENKIPYDCLDLSELEQLADEINGEVV